MPEMAGNAAKACKDRAEECNEKEREQQEEKGIYFGLCCAFIMRRRRLVDRI